MPPLLDLATERPDRWTLLRTAALPGDVPDGLPSIVPLALWLGHRNHLHLRGDIGVWLMPHEDPGGLAADVASLPLIAVDFPQFTDGRGYSIARLLRDRLGFTGELRAIGNVLRDQIYALAECGFDAFLVHSDRDAAHCLENLEAFAGIYASTARTPQPWFRRRPVEVGSDAMLRADEGGNGVS